MPELPEVETIKSQLQPILPFRIDDFYFSNKTNRIIKSFDFNLHNFTITKISRHAKWLIFELKPYGYLLSHLGMSGSWQMSHSPLNHKHGHIQFIDNGKTENGVLTYIDPRRFGHFYILNEENFRLKMSQLPIDITHPDFDENKISELFFQFPNKMIKPFLLDQKAFPGIGNYMASEICARAGILPTRLTGNIQDFEILKIQSAIQIVISGAIETKGTTFSGGYRDALGSKGEGIKHLVVFYQTHCQLCANKNIKTAVIKTILNTRGTYHCPICQS
jgi:formamidopyrimidine-DNA glycosylase